MFYHHMVFEPQEPQVYDWVIETLADPAEGTVIEYSDRSLTVL